MKIETHPLENHELKVEVEVTPDEFETYMRKAAGKISRQAKIPGFRPGKVPYEIIRRNYGDAAIAQEALDLMLEKQYEQILKDGDINPGGMGRVDKVDEINPPKFSLIIPLAPVVDLGNYRDLREDFEETTLSDEELNDAMNELKSKYATEEPTEGPAKEGQVAYVMLKAELEEADEESGSKDLIRERPFEVVIGKDTDAKSAWPYVGYSNALIGANPNDVIETEFTYSENAPLAMLKDKKAHFTTTLQSIKNIVMPEETLELAKNYGEYESFDAFKEDVHARLLDQKKRMQENEYIEKMVDKLVAQAEIKYAPNALEEEAQDMLNAFKHRISHQGLDLDTYLKVQKKDMEAFLNEEIHPNAESQLKRRLVIQKFGAEEKINLDVEKFKQALSTFEENAANEFKRAKTKKDRDAISNYVTTNAMNQAYSDTLFERLIAIGKGENPPIDPTAEETDVKAADQAADEPVTVRSDEMIEPAAAETETATKPAKKTARKSTKKAVKTETDDPAEEKNEA